MAKMKMSDLKQDKKMINAAVHKHERADHPGKPLTTLKKGGMASADMKKMGRGMTKAALQKSSKQIKKVGI